MTEQVPHYNASKFNGRIIVKQNIEWSIEMSAREKCLYITTLDYHAGPLRLTAGDIRKYGKLLAKKSRERRKLQSKRVK